MARGGLIPNLIREEIMTQLGDTCVELLQAAEALLQKLDEITTDSFSKGGERLEREALRTIIAKIKG